MGPVLLPILLAAYPVLSLFQQNQSEIDPKVLFKALAVAAVAAAALFVLARLFVKRSERAAVLASLVVIAFFYYGIFTRDVARSGSDRTLFPIWIALFVLATIAVLRSRSDLINLNRGLAAFAVVILVVPVYKTVKYRIDNPPVSISDARLWPSALQNLGSSNSQNRPDVYYIIPDDYARPDVLKRYFRYDDSGFVRELEKRGFVMAPGTRSPYSKSELNMAAALNMDYLSRLPQILGKSSQDVLLPRKMIEDSRASHVLKALGYSYTHIDSDDITFAADNPHISTLAAPDNLTYLWLRRQRAAGGGRKVRLRRGRHERAFPAQRPYGVRPPGGFGQEAQPEIRPLPHVDAA